MAGIIGIVVLIICYLAKCHEDTWNRENTGNRYYYIDRKGVYHLREWPHTKCFDEKLPNGHIVLKDRNHNILVDMTEEDQKREWELHPEKRPNYEQIDLAGYTVKQYTSYTNGEEKHYSVFYYKDADWNFDLDTLKMIGPTDAQLKKEETYKNHGLRHYTPEGFKAVMDEFNALPERERAGIAAECDGAVGPKRGYFNTIYDPARMSRGWSYFDQKGIPIKDNKNRVWIK